MTVDFRLYLITDRKTCAPRSLQSVVREACDAGVRAVQLREKDLNEKETEEYTQRLLDITRPRGAKLFLNRKRPFDTADEVFIAASLGTDGFHMTSAVPFPHELRSRFPKLTVGISTHSVEQVVAASAEGADFVTFGPVFETPSKAVYGEPLGLKNLTRAVAAAAIPVIAIGGITPDNAADCVAAGAHGVAVIRSVAAAPDINEVIGRFKTALGSL